MTTTPGTRFAVAYAALTASHDVADYWIQHPEDAVHKGESGQAGHLHCARHVATYTATQAAALYAANRAFGLGITGAKGLAALALSAATHYYADRSGGQWRTPRPRSLAALAHRCGKAGWIEADPTAGPHLDQAWHKGMIALAAAVAAR